MDLKDVHDNQNVVITGAAEGHPLNGARATVILVTGPLPEVPPRSLRDPSLRGIIGLSGSNLPGEAERAARAFRKESLEHPFAYPNGQVMLSLWSGSDGKGVWPFPYITAGPEHIEPAS